MANSNKDWQPGLSAFAVYYWREDDHLMSGHLCTDGWRQGRLPNWWREQPGGRIEPSFHCGDCGLHTWGLVGQRPEMAHA